MNRRELLKTMATSAAALAARRPLSAQSGLASGQAAKRPNVVYIFADQLRYESCGFAGDSQAMTPNLDRLAQEGVSFRNAISNTPVCAAYRASLFTGKHTSSTGMVVNELRINPRQRCLGHAITDAGYETGYIGKWHLWGNTSHHDQLSNSYIPPSSRNHRLGWDGEWKACNFNHEYYKAYYVGDEPEKRPIEAYEPDWQTDQAIDFIERHAAGENPFYLTLSYGPPHNPWTADNVPEEWMQRFADVRFSLPATWSDTPDPYMDRNTEPGPWLSYWKENLEEFQRVYYAQTANIDWNLGRVLEALEARGIADDTLVVFTSDHGEQLGQNSRVFKLTFYEPSCRIPFVARWPNGFKGGRAVDTLFGTSDVAPTLLGFLGLEVPEEMEGVDLSGALTGESSPSQEALLLQGMGHTYRWLDGFEWRAARSERYTYARYLVDGSELFFDNEADPQQSRNLIGDAGYRTDRKRLRSWMEAKMESLNDAFQSCSWYKDRWTTADRKIVRSAAADWSELGV